MNDALLAYLKNKIITKGMSLKEIIILCDYAQIISHKPKEVIFEEGELSRDIYFIIEGKVNLLKWDEEKKYKLNIAQLAQNEMFGEMSFLDGEPRSSSVIAETPTRLLKISQADINPENPKTRAIYNTLINNIAEININRLRSTNQNYVQSLRAQIEALDQRNRFGYLFMSVIFMVFLGNVLQTLFLYYGIVPTSESATWAYSITMLIPLLFVVKKCGYSMNDVGVTTRNFKKSVIGASSISVALILFTAISYWIYQLLLGHPASLLNILVHPFFELDYMNVLRYFFSAYLQELAARGIGQTSLQNFMDDKKGIRSVVFVSFLFGTFHLFRGIEAGITVFLGSVFLGFIYLHYKNLIATTIVHVVLGVIALTIKAL